MTIMCINNESDISEYLDIVEIRTREIKTYYIKIIKHFDNSDPFLRDRLKDTNSSSDGMFLLAIDYDKIIGKKLIIKSEKEKNGIIIEDDEREIASCSKGAIKDVEIGPCTDTILLIALNRGTNSLFEGYYHDSLVTQKINQICEFIKNNELGTIVKGSF